MPEFLATIDDFNRVILNEAGEKLVVIDFTALWCSPCKRIGPIFDQFAQKYAENALFYKASNIYTTTVCNMCIIL